MGILQVFFVNRARPLWRGRPARVEAFVVEAIPRRGIEAEVVEPEWDRVAISIA
jgi:hypothetical protein